MSLASRTVVAEIFLTRLLAILDGTGVGVYGYNEHAPDEDDQPSGQAARWVKLHWPKMHELKRVPREGDHRGFTVTLSVGLSDEELADDAYRLSRDIDTVVAAARSVAGEKTVDGVTTTIEVKSVEGDDLLDDGDHPETTVGVVTVTGTAQTDT